MPPGRAAVYCRKSHDPHKTRASVERQAAICDGLIERENLQLVAGSKYEDNDVTASGKKVRADFERLLEATARGDHDVIVAWETERLYRRLGDQERLFDACEAAGVRLLTRAHT